VQVVGTPWEFITAVEKKFGYLSIDLAATDENAKAIRWITPEQDTFKQNWAEMLDGGRGWLNPEFDPLKTWTAKCALEQQRGAEILVLTPASIGANWFWEYVQPYATVYSVGRMIFEGSVDPYPKDLILSHYNQNPNHELQRWRWK
jgi:phage N-6-adenine-methyltransferase